MSEVKGDAIKLAQIYYKSLLELSKEQLATLFLSCILYQEMNEYEIDNLILFVIKPKEDSK